MEEIKGGWYKKFRHAAKQKEFSVLLFFIFLFLFNYPLFLLLKTYPLVFAFKYFFVVWFLLVVVLFVANFRNDSK
jgi:hypothetical protein